MSWGFFLDLDLSVPTKTWKVLQASTPSDLPAGWWGFNEDELEVRFTGDLFDDINVKKVLSLFTDGESSAKSITERAATTRIELCTLLDRGGDTQVAKPFAALVEAASKVGGVGHIQLVNDGSYSGEAGVRVTLAKGVLVREPVANQRELREVLLARVYPDLEHELEKYRSPTAKQRMAPAAKKQQAAKARQQSSTKKKPAAKKQPVPKPAKQRR